MRLVNRTSATGGPLIRPHMPELDSVRGVAILLVLFLHGFGMFNPASFTGTARLFVGAASYGWTGVQLFFVLSGFLITGILLDSKPRPDYYKRFYIRRAVRILPAYYGMLLVLAVLSRTGWLGTHAVGMPFLTLSLVYLSNVTPLLGIPMQYTVFWSLAVEEHFYLIWPAVVRRLSTRALTSASVGVFVLVPVVRAISMQFGPAGDHNFYTWCNADGLALGALVAIALREYEVQRKQLCRAVVLTLAGVIATLLWCAHFNTLSWNSTIGFAVRLSVLNLGFAAILVLSLLIGTSRWKSFVNVSALRFFGEISYGLYLYHMLFFFIYEHIVIRLWPSLMAANGHFRNITLQFVAAGGTSILLSFISKRYFENYFLSLKDRFSEQAEKHVDDARTLPWVRYDLPSAG